MKASILLKKLNCGNYIANITKELSKIKDIYNVSTDKDASRISFVYSSEGAALEVAGIINSFCKLSNNKEDKLDLKVL